MFVFKDWRKLAMVILSLLAGELVYKIFDFSWWMAGLVLVGWLLFLKLPKKVSWILLPILFLAVLAINKLFNMGSFDWEKIVWTNPDYLKLINRYWQEDLWLPFKIRNLFYSSWLLIFSWLNLVFKLISPAFLVRMLGFSGVYLIFFGFVQLFSRSGGISLRSKKLWQPLIWWLVVVAASGCGMLVDSKSALILALPAIIYFMYLGVDNKIFEKYQKYWWLLLIIDILLK